MAERLVFTGYCNGNSNKPINLYVTYDISQSIANNQSTITCGMYITTPPGWNIGPWTDYGSYLPTTGSTFTHSLPNFSGSHTITSGRTMTVNHDSAGNATATIYWKAGYNASWGGFQKPSGSFNITLPQIPRQANLSSAPNFNDEDNPTINYSNPAGNSVSSLQACISLTGSTDDIVYRDVSKTGTSYTFNLTTAERNVLRNACTTANSRNVIFFLKTVIGGNTFYSTITRTLSIVNANPTLNPTVTDSNSTTVALTGSSANLVKYYSNAAWAFNASALKGASITSYSLTNGSKSSTNSSGTFDNIESNSFVFTVKDSRGNQTSITRTPTMVDYVKLSTNLQVYVDVAGTATLTIDGNYFNNSFGSQSNTLTVKYRYKTSGGSYGSWTTGTATKSGNTYHLTPAITGLDYRASYVFQVQALDKLMTATSPEIAAKALPVFDWWKDGFEFNVPVYINTNNAAGALFVNGSKKF